MTRVSLWVYFFAPFLVRSLDCKKQKATLNMQKGGKRLFCQDPVRKTETVGVILTRGLEHRGLVTWGHKSQTWTARTPDTSCCGSHRQAEGWRDSAGRWCFLRPGQPWGTEWDPTGAGGLVAVEPREGAPPPARGSTGSNAKGERPLWFNLP